VFGSSGASVPNSIPKYSPHALLVGKLKSIFDLGPDEVEALRELPLEGRAIDEDSDVVREGDRPTDCCLLISGFLFRYKGLPNGSRQIVSLHVPGDIPDLQSLHLEVMDHSLGALAPSVIARIPHAAVNDLIRRFPRIGDALWRDTLVDASIFREWVANVGRRSAYERMAHLVCEFFMKMKAVGLTQGSECMFPLTQAELGDATGLSVVHVNRTLQELRADGMIVLRGRTLSIPDWAALARVGMFNPSYLHLRGQAAA
jgi:CRP-like cAMP-binding protein